MTPRKLYVQQLLPALRSFLAGYTNRELGMGKDIARGADVADILLNLPDYIFRDTSRPAELTRYQSSKVYRKQRCWVAEPLYELTCDFANAWKHRTITRDRRSLDGIDSAKEVFAICRFQDEAGTYYRSTKLVMVRVPDGREMDLRRMLIGSARFWADEMSALGYIPPTPPSILEFTEYITREDEDAARPLKLHGYQHEHLHVEGRCFDFDGIRKCLVDAPGESGFDGKAQFEFTIHPSPFEA